MTVVETWQGAGPIVLGIPHSSTYVPDEIFEDLNVNGRNLTDTDWHIDRLFEDLETDVSIVKAKFHRYVIDANRDPSGQSLYPNQNTTNLVPTSGFDGASIWIEPPTRVEIENRTQTFHRPYHGALKAELERVRAIHGVAILLDCHSIRSQIPFLFEGTLPDLNVGTNNGATCALSVENAVLNIAMNAQGYNAVLNGRFKGGWTTRHYGQPDLGIHAIQLEIAQSTYLTAQNVPWDFNSQKAIKLQKHIKSMLVKLAELAPTLGGSK